MSNNLRIERTRPIPDGCREIWFAGGCFWGTQEYLAGVAGVIATNVGYANGHKPNPTYREVCAHTTGYAEAVYVVYNPAVVSLRFLLSLYFKSVNPTSVNRQGGDVGDQYRTGIYYSDVVDLPVIQAAIVELAKSLNKPVVIEVLPIQSYYVAEEAHQDYLKKNPGGYCHVPPALISSAREVREYAPPDPAQLKQTLTPLQYNVTQNAATESPFNNAYNSHFAPGIYVDITTGQPLFVSTDKFESGCGWPAFSKPIAPEVLTDLTDLSHGMQRTEVKNRISNAHLGHVFEDGPAETGGLRYCINSAALRFVPKERMVVEGYGHLLHLLEQAGSE